jgi:putative ABC transport system permease protein
MSFWQIAIQSLRYYWRTNLAVALGVAAATAVLTGALIVGDSMRQSLTSLTFDRLGKIDELLVSQGFFRARLADEIRETAPFKKGYSSATPAILFPGGTVEFDGESGSRRAGSVSVMGVTKDFWELGNQTIRHDTTPLEGESVIINDALAEDLQIQSADVAAGTAKLTLRIPKQNQLPADSVLGKQKDLIESLVDLRVNEIVPTQGLGRFGLHPSQADPLNAYVPIQLLQESLRRTVLKYKSDSEQANVVLISGNGSSPPSKPESDQLRQAIRPTLEDYGLQLKRVTQTFGKDDQLEPIFDYWSLSSSRMLLDAETVSAIEKAFPNAKPVYTYLANDIRKPAQEGGVPFSMVSAIDFDDAFQPVSEITGEPIRKLSDGEIVLNREGANRFGAEIGDELILTYFEPETSHGAQVEQTAKFKLIDIATLTEPSSAFVVPRRGPIKPAAFDDRPAITNDPDLTPEVPGVTDAESIENWDLPFNTAERIESEDDQYWSNYRTTPKGFVSLSTGRRLWGSRFGSTTSFRIPTSAGSAAQISGRLLDQFTQDQVTLGLELVPIKRRGLAASSGSTPFDVLFLALSMFVIGSALILVALLFRLGFQQRASEVGLLSATGFDQRQVRRLWLIEMSFVSLIGALIGIVLGIGYAALMIWGLSTWWVGAISKPFLELHIGGLSLAIGLISGLLVCIVTIAWSLRNASRQDVRRLLLGEIESTPRGGRKSRRSMTWLIATLFVAAVGLSVLASGLSGEAQAGSFMGSGFFVLVALLLLVHRFLRSDNSDTDDAVSMRLSTLAVTNARRNPLRSTLTIGLVSVASFLIVAVSAFRLAPTEEGTGGFDWVAKSSQPVLEDLSTEKGRLKSLGTSNQLAPGTVVMPLRFKPGEDASCNNLYQSTQPRALGVPESFVKFFDNPQNSRFAWAGSLAETEADINNPWRLVSGEPHLGTQADPIPVVIDKNTANYSLKIYMLDSILKVDYDSGESLYFKVVGFLGNTILQGSLIMSESDFVNAFKSIGGYQYFLIRDGERADSLASLGQSSNIDSKSSSLWEWRFKSSHRYSIQEHRKASGSIYHVFVGFSTLLLEGACVGCFGFSFAFTGTASGF